MKINKNIVENIYTIYVLKCENNKFYIEKAGKTEDYEKRISDHLNGIGCEFTKKYKPINIIEIKHNMDSSEEDKLTKLYMAKYGIDNVRGGSYTKFILSENEKKPLKEELYSIFDECFSCEEYGQFIK